MDQHQYQLMIKRLEVDAIASPDLFRKKALLISSVAHLVLFGMAGILALFLYHGLVYIFADRNGGALFLVILLALAMSPAFLIVLRMLCMRLPVPEGRLLSRKEASKLFQELEKMRKSLKGPPVHHVLIQEDGQTGFFQQPRWGFVGKPSNYLILGLPYLLGATSEEMQAAVAREYSHLCDSHSKISAWVYRQRRTFCALLEQVNATFHDNQMEAAIARMLEKFLPYYHAYTLVLSREHEYEADKTAAHITNAAATASGLIRTALLSRWIKEEFWPKLHQQVDSIVKPAALPYQAMSSAFKSDYSEWATKERLAVVWNEQPGQEDTWPPLRERVEALGEESALPACATVSAADALLGPHASVLVEEFDNVWWKQEQERWEARYHEVTRSKRRLKELSLQPVAAMTLQELQEFALLCAEFASAQIARKVLEHLLRQPGGPFPKAAYLYGCILLEEDNESGLDHLLAAAKADRHICEPVAQTGHTYLNKKQGEQKAQQWWDKIMLIEANHERNAA